MSVARRAALVAAGGVALFGLVTLWALEGREVVTLRTHAPDGSVRETRTWIADADGAHWVEAANPERPFLLDLRHEARLEVVRGGRVEKRVATVIEDEGAHLRIRGLLRERYGAADMWIGLLADTSRSVAVRLDPPMSAPWRGPTDADREPMAFGEADARGGSRGD